MQDLVRAAGRSKEIFRRRVIWWNSYVLDCRGPLWTRKTHGKRYRQHTRRERDDSQDARLYLFWWADLCDRMDDHGGDRQFLSKRSPSEGGIGGC